MSNLTKQQLENRVRTLENIVTDLHWMARRYADGRSSYAVGLLNNHTIQLVQMGVKLNPTADNKLLAHDGQENVETGLFCISPNYLEIEREYLKKYRDKYYA